MRSISRAEKFILILSACWWYLGYCISSIFKLPKFTYTAPSFKLPKLELRKRAKAFKDDHKVEYVKSCPIGKEYRSVFTPQTENCLIEKPGCNEEKRALFNLDQSIESESEGNIFLFGCMLLLPIVALFYVEFEYNTSILVFGLGGIGFLFIAALFHRTEFIKYKYDKMESEILEKGADGIIKEYGDKSYHNRWYG